MDEFESLSHSKWECKYHVVFIPKCRRKVLYGNLRKHLGEVFRKLAEQKECRIEEGHLLADHVHMMISIPPKHAVSQVVGFIKGKSAIHLARVYGERKQNYAGQSFWARGYFVPTVGRDEKDDSGVHPQPGEGRPEDRPDEPLEINPATFRWRNSTGAASATPQAASSGSHKKAPGSAGGTLLDSIDVASLPGLRDRALIGLMVYTFARVGAATSMKVEDFFVQGRRGWVRLHEKGGKEHEMPTHHNLDRHLGSISI